MGETQEKTKSELFTDWVQLYSDKLYSWAEYKTSSKEIAEDLVQDTFMDAFKSFDNFQERSNPYTWLSSILNNKIVDYYRANSRKNLFEDENVNQLLYAKSDALFNEDESWKLKNEPLFSNEDSKLLDNEDFVISLELCYNQLPLNWKQAVQAKYIFNVDSNQICNELSITPANYWKIIQRAKLLLKQCLEINWFKKN